MSNRIAEDSLYAAEAVSAIARNFADGEDYTVNYKTAWEKVLFNQFHDIITGSGVRETREYAMGEIQKTLGFTYTGTSKAMIAIAGQIDTSAIAVDTNLLSTSEGGGVGYRGSNEINSTMIANQTIYAAERGNGNTRIVHIFNPTGFDREETTEITLWDYSGKTDQIAITDSNGEPVEFKLVEHNGFWGHEFDKILLFAKVKAFGYNTYIIKQTAKTDFFLTGSLEPRTEKYKKNVLENEFIRAEFDDNNMILKKLIDKRTGNVLINGDSAFFKLVMQSHKSHTVMFGNAWVEGMETKSVNLNETEQVFVTEQSYDNQLRQHITYSIPFMASLLKVTVILDKNATSLRFKVDCDWQERFAEATGIPTLKFAVPVAYNVDAYKYESQFGVATRGDQNHDVPARSFACAVNSESDTGVAVYTDSIYGYRGENRAINLTLIRSSQFPDPYPENGQHCYNIGVGVSESENMNFYRQSSAFIHPFINVAGTSHKGDMPLSHSFFTTQGDIVVSTVKTSEDSSDGLVLRVFDVSGKGTEGSIIFDRTIKSAQTLDINEDPVSTVLNVSDKTVSFRLKSFEIITLKINT
jgi:alpha-mannosidase